MNALANGVFYRLPSGSTQWTATAAPIPDTPRNSLSVAADGKLYSVEGKSASALEYTGDGIARTALPDLPVAVASGDLEVLGGSLYVAGVDAAGRNVFLRGAEMLPPWSQTPARRVLTAHSQGILYVFSEETDDRKLTAYAYNPNQSSWTRLGISELPVAADTAFASGDAHILFLGSDFRGLSAFYLTQKRWVQFESALLPVSGIFPDSDPSAFTVASSGGLRRVSPVLPATKYGLPDHLVVIAFFLLMLWMGRHFSKREKTQQDFFRGGQRFPAWAIGLSMFATGASAISLMAMPAKSYMENWIYFLGGPIQFLFLPLVFFVIIPIARRLQFSSAYEYLEARYCPAMRKVGSVTFVLSQVVGRFSGIMLLPALAISTIGGIPVEVSIVVMGVVTTVYCMMGGFEAVVWTDVIQAFVMLIAVGLCAVWALAMLDVPTGQVWEIVRVEDKLRLADLSWDVTQPILTILVIVTVLNVLMQVGDQNFIQRVQALPTEKAARWAATTQVAVAIPLNALLFGLGTCLYVFYHFHPQDIPPAMKADSIFPLFAAQKLPPGLGGLVVAALMAATMSTLSSAMNSVSNVIVADFVLPVKKTMSAHGMVLWGKVLTVLVGMAGTLLTLWLARSSTTSVWDLIIWIMGVLFSPLGTLFVMGVLTTRVHTGGILAGFVAGYAATLYATYHLTLHPFFYGPVGLIPSMIVAYLFCWIFPRRKPRDLSGLTVFSLPPKPAESQ